MERILVTGGAGLIGSHLCERLLAEGNEVICLDNLSTGGRENTSYLSESPHFSLVIHDVCEPFHFDVDAIYHLAAPASPVHYQKDPVQTTRTCVLGAINALELAGRLGVPVLCASTSEVYGDPEVHPQPETYAGHVNPIGPRSCYDEGKRCAESLFFDYHRSRGVGIKVVRIFNTYGPRMRADDGRVVSNFIVQALQGESLAVHGDGHQTRSFCYVDDLVEGLLTVMRLDASFTGPVNLGNPEEVSIATLAETVARLTGVECRFRHQARLPDDPTCRRPDISLAVAKLGWAPAVGLEDGLQRTVAYFRNRSNWCNRRRDYIASLP